MKIYRQLSPRRTGFVLALVTLLSINGRADAQSESIQWNLKEGDSFSVALVQNSDSETKIDARETTIENETRIEMDWQVTSVAENGDTTIEQSLTRVVLSVTGYTRKKQGAPASPLMAISFDTSNPTGISKESKTLLKQIQPLLGLPFEVVMSPQGEIVEVNVPDTLEKQLEKMPDTQQLRQLFSKAGLKDLLGASAVVLPTEVEPGKSWSEESPVATALGKFNRKRTYTYDGRKTVDGRELAEFTFEINLDPVESEQSQQNALQGKLNEFSGSGKLSMDVEGGYLKSSSSKNQVVSEKPYREKTIETDVKNRIEMLVTKK